MTWVDYPHPLRGCRVCPTTSGGCCTRSPSSRARTNWSRQGRTTGSRSGYQREATAWPRALTVWTRARPPSPPRPRPPWSYPTRGTVQALSDRIAVGGIPAALGGGGAPGDGSSAPEGNFKGLLSQAKAGLSSSNRPAAPKPAAFEPPPPPEVKKSESDLQWEELEKNLRRPLKLKDIDFTDLNRADDTNFLNTVGFGGMQGGGTSAPPPPPPMIPGLGPPPPPPSPGGGLPPAASSTRGPTAPSWSSTRSCPGQEIKDSEAALEGCAHWTNVAIRETHGNRVDKGNKHIGCYMIFFVIIIIFYFENKDLQPEAADVIFTDKRQFLTMQGVNSTRQRQK